MCTHGADRYLATQGMLLAVRQPDNFEPQSTDLLGEVRLIGDQDLCRAVERPECSGVKVIVMPVRDVDEVGPHLFEYAKIWERIVPPLRTEARSTPPRVRQDRDRTSLDQEGSVSDERDLHRATRLRPQGPFVDARARARAYRVSRRLDEPTLRSQAVSSRLPAAPRLL